MTTLSDLIAKLEAAQEGSRELDHEIFLAVALPTSWCGSKIIGHFRDGDGYGYNTEDGYRHLDCDKPARYTTSLDAALTLVPDEPRNEPAGRYDWQVEQTNGGLTVSARVGSKDTLSFAETPALALCIAALKAREAKP